MNRKEITWNCSNEGTRNEVRMRVIKKFSIEEPGTGKGDKASGYRYFVETLQNGDRVYLDRPANLHNGFDFLVCVENTNYAPKNKRLRRAPKHDDLHEDLKKKRKENLVEYEKLYNMLEKVFNCKDVTDSEIKKVKLNVGLSPEHVIKVMKWLFIEQDIRYWNYSGRKMTWDIVPNI